MQLRKLTPVMIVDRIEDALDFWERRFGFSRTIEVPHEDRLGFVALARDGVEVMLQSVASVGADVPALVPSGPASAVGLFIVVDDLAPFLEAAQGCEITVPERRTFYGAHEVGVRAPGGAVVVFAAFAEAPGT